MLVSFAVHPTIMMGVADATTTCLPTSTLMDVEDSMTTTHHASPMMDVADSMAKLQPDVAHSTNVATTDMEVIIDFLDGKVEVVPMQDICNVQLLATHVS
jgi:hypothetical protein